MAFDMRVAVVGAGGIGCYLGARLLEHGFDVAFLARGATLAGLRETGLTVESPAGNVRFERVSATDDPREIGSVGLAVVAVKAWDVDGALETAGALLARPTIVLTTQNGIEPPLAIADRVGRDRTIIGLFRLPTLVVGPGHVRHIGGNIVEIGVLAPGVPRELLEKLCTAFGTRSVISDDVVTAMWDKMIGIAVTTAIGAAARAPLGVLLDLPEVRELVLAAAREAIAVARAHDARLPENYLESRFSNPAAFSRSTIFSTQRDLMHGRPSELDTQITAISRLGRARGVATPIFDVIATLLLAQDLKARGTIHYECT